MAQPVLDEGAARSVVAAARLRRALMWIVVGLLLSSGGGLSKGTPGGGYVEIPGTAAGLLVVVGVTLLPSRSLGRRSARLRVPLVVAAAVMATAPLLQAVVWTTPAAVIGALGTGATYVLLSAALTLAAEAFDDSATARLLRVATVAAVASFVIGCIWMLADAVGVNTSFGYRGEHLVREGETIGSPIQFAFVAASIVPFIVLLVSGWFGVIGLFRTTKHTAAAHS